MKTCTKCGETKPLQDFNRQTKSRDGRHNYANTQPVHPVCNLRKGTEVGARL